MGGFNPDQGSPEVGLGDGLGAGVGVGSIGSGSIGNGSIGVGSGVGVGAGAGSGVGVGLGLGDGAGNGFDLPLHQTEPLFDCPFGHVALGHLPPANRLILVLESTLRPFAPVRSVLYRLALLRLASERSDHERFALSRFEL